MNDLTSAVVHFCMLQYISFILKTMAKPIETLTYLPSWLQLPFTAVSKLAKYVAVLTPFSHCKMLKLETSMVLNHLDQ